VGLPQKITAATFPSWSQAVLTEFFAEYHPNLKPRIVNTGDQIQFLGSKTAMDIAFSYLKGFQAGMDHEHNNT
jgi:hypothetical protein